MKVIFKTIDENIPIKNYDGLGFRFFGTIVTLILLIWIASVFKPGKLIIFLLLVILAIFVFRFGRRLLPDWILKKDFLGELHLNSEEILLIKKSDLESFKIDELSNLSLTHNYIRGETLGKSPIFNGIAEINFQIKNQKHRIVKFVIENKEQFSTFKLVLKSWYLKGLRIDEFFSEEKLKSLNLEIMGDKSYEEIQRLKKELNLK